MVSKLMLLKNIVSDNNWGHFCFKGRIIFAEVNKFNSSDCRHELILTMNNNNKRRRSILSANIQLKDFNCKMRPLDFDLIFEYLVLFYNLKFIFSLQFLIYHNKCN